MQHARNISPAFGEIGLRTDVYGLGALLYCLLSGRPPFVGAGVAETLSLVLSSRSADPPSLRNSAVLATLDEVCRACLTNEPPDRLPTADELVARLKSISEDWNPMP